MKLLKIVVLSFLVAGPSFGSETIKPRMQKITLIGAVDATGYMMIRPNGEIWVFKTHDHDETGTPTNYEHNGRYEVYSPDDGRLLTTHKVLGAPVDGKFIDNDTYVGIANIMDVFKTEGRPDSLNVSSVHFWREGEEFSLRDLKYGLHSRSVVADGDMLYFGLLEGGLVRRKRDFVGQTFEQHLALRNKLDELRDLLGANQNRVYEFEFEDILGKPKSNRPQLSVLEPTVKGDHIYYLETTSRDRITRISKTTGERKTIYENPPGLGLSDLSLDFDQGGRRLLVVSTTTNEFIELMLTENDDVKSKRTFALPEDPRGYAMTRLGHCALIARSMMREILFVDLLEMRELAKWDVSEPGFVFSNITKVAVDSERKALRLLSKAPCEKLSYCDGSTMQSVFTATDATADGPIAHCLN